MNFANWGGVKKPKSDIQSQFSTLKIIRIFLIFFFIEEYEFRAHFLLLIFFITSIFKSLYFRKWCSIFDSSSLLQFSKPVLLCYRLISHRESLLFSFYQIIWTEILHDSNDDKMLNKRDFMKIINLNS